MMGLRMCMNALCGTGATHEWKKGWPLRSGGCADLCFNCGSAYENLVFCETYHLEEPGWRECYLCRKRLHCGCVASKSLVEILDYGGVGCSACSMTSRLHSIQRDEIRNGFCDLKINDADDLRSTSVENRVVGDGPDEGKLSQLCRIMEANEPTFLQPSHRSDRSVSRGQEKREEVIQLDEVGAGFSGATQPSVGAPKFAKPDSGRTLLDIRDARDPTQPSLNMTLGGPLRGSSNFVLPLSNGSTDGKEQSKTSPPFQQGQRSRPLLPKPSKYGPNISSETSKGTSSLRIARPPADGRGKNHLLPRYWPRITDQELQQLSGDLNSTIVPLFEKVLSASDAGRIGRLVLPKACAEAYFPSISQSEGIPLKIQDVKGKEWVFQFRFWPNNNSRMYVLEGVTPCIQSMQLRAGDTITFSRLDPGGKLIMGFRKATNSDDTQDTQTSAVQNGTSAETSLSGTTQNHPTANGYSGLFPTQKGSKESHRNLLSEHLSLANGDLSWSKSSNHGARTYDDSSLLSVPTSDKKRTRHIGSKSKRLLMNSDEAMELRLTWEEAQELLRPPLSAQPSIVTIEDQEFEEYDEPPVFGKRTIFTTQLSGDREQWAQCDDCSKWRKLPLEVLLPPKWTCSDNIWDPIRCSCSAQEEVSPKDLEDLVRVNKESKKRKIVDSHKLAPECEPTGLDALASAAVLGDNAGDPGEASVGATTKHPRHRPGCSCIVCIQPPSGKGKHKPTCTCNVCLTVKRRFKTLMLRKKRRQSEREAAAEIAQCQRDDNEDNGGESEMIGSTNNEVINTNTNNSGTETSQKRSHQGEMVETGNGQIDLNCDPNREDMQMDEQGGLNIMNIVEATSMPLEKYMQPNGGIGRLSSCLLEQNNGDNERLMTDEGFLASVGWGQNQQSNI